MTMKIAIATKRHDLHRLAYAAIGTCDSQNVSDTERCCDILRHLKRLNLSVKDLCHSKAILPLASLRDHKNPKIRREAHVLFNSWMHTLYFGGRNSSTGDNAPPLNLKKATVVKENEHQISPDITAAESKKKTELFVSMENEGKRSQAHETSGEIKYINDCKSFAAAKLLQRKKHLVKLSEKPKLCPALKSMKDDDCRTQKKSDAVHQVISKLKMTDDQRSSRALETGEIKQKLMKPEDCKSIAARSTQAKKQLTLPTKKKQLPLKMSQKHQPLKKNSAEMLELFEIAKKSADKANAKGLLASEAETSICVDTLSLLMDYPISSTATETRRIVLRLEHLTKHKNRRICNSASALLHHWRQSFKDQGHH